MTKLLITRINAYGLSSLLVLPILYSTQSWSFLSFILPLYISIFFITKYFAKNRSHLLQLLGESILTTYSSYSIAVIISTVIYSNTINILPLLLYGLPASIVIGFVLFFLNAITIIKPHNQT